MTPETGMYHTAEGTLVLRWLCAKATTNNGYMDTVCIPLSFR